MFKRFFYALLLSPAALVQQVDAAATDSFGGSGGRPFTIACENGQKIGGFQVNVGKALDGVGIACVPINAQLQGDPIIDGFAGHAGGGMHRYTLARPRYVKSITFSYCKYKKHTVLRSFRVSYYVPGSRATGMSQTYGTRCDSSAGPTRTLSAPQGQHIYGLFGKSGKLIDSLGALYRPLPVMGRQTRVPLAAVVTPLNNRVFKKSKIRIDNLGSYNRNGGYLADASYIDIAGYRETFSVEPYSHRKHKGVYRWEIYIDDLNSSDIALSRGNANALPYLKLMVEFETKGREIKGFCRKKVGKKYYLCRNHGDGLVPDANLESPRVKVQAIPEVFNGVCGGSPINSVVLTATGADFDGGVKLAGNMSSLPDSIEDRIKRGLEDRLRKKEVEKIANSAEKAIEHQLRVPGVQCAMAVPIRNAVLNPLGLGSITGVGIDGNDLVIGY